MAGKVRAKQDETQMSFESEAQRGYDDNAKAETVACNPGSNV